VNADRELTFEKWQGLGNDFIVVAHEDVPEGALSDERVRQLCDRRLGIGADGILLVRNGAELGMLVRNADGSRPEMCGNGLRCVVGWLAGRGRIDLHSAVEVKTDAGPRRCEIVESIAGGYEVRVQMGIANARPDLEVRVDGEPTRWAMIDVGNPHAIRFDVDLVELSRLGPAVATAPPQGTNVELCRVARAPDERVEIEVAVWERGVGPTRACGTGACAVAAAACAAGLADYGRTMIVRLPGGPLQIEVDEQTRAVTMTGPARCVFRGTTTLPNGSTSRGV